MAREKASKVRNYSPAELYMMDEEIFHPVFNDTGKVLEVGITNDGVRKITVDFPKAGKKRLVMDYKAS